MHPLQSFSKTRGPEQLDGAWAAVSAESDEARTTGFWLAETLGLRPFALADDARAAYHAGAAVASNYLVTLREAAGSLLASAGAPPEALEPLMRGVIDNGFELTGPIARGDWETVERHLDVIREQRPELEELYVVLARATAAIAGREIPSDTVSQGDSAAPTVCRTIAGLRAELAASRLDLRRARAHDGIPPRRPPFAPPRRPRRVRDGRHEPLRQSGPVLRGRPRSLSA